MKYINAALALTALAAAIYDMVNGDWLRAALTLLLAVWLAWTVDWREPPVENVPLPGDGILSKGYEPVETPADEAPLTWEDHSRDCRICQERNL